jgi:hypothetical protein
LKEAEKLLHSIDLKNYNCATVCLEKVLARRKAGDENYKEGFLG